MINTREIIEIGNILQRGLSSSETFESIFQLLDRSIPFESATLFAFDREKGKLDVVLQRGTEVVDLANEIHFSKGNGLSGWICGQRKPIILPSLTHSAPRKLHEFNSFISMPLWVGDRLVGVLNLGHMETHVYRLEDMDDFITISSQVSLVMEKILLRAQLETQNTLLKQALQELEAVQAELIEKERLAAIGQVVVRVNHEINNPLSSIIGLAEILEMMVETGSLKKARESADAILKQARRIQKVTHQLSQIGSSESEAYIGGIQMTKLPAIDS